ncbi:baseplate J/gp47 family protein [Alicyclobacillus shizuokensis]|uniref:baseplate J/gp47 family protein n=1 Tax=Alicyclobacillus shizuokensis TaxID=392014 RepID=UPI00082ABF63|nr:baseplate J/gp47 family protein [Alicyclobacillus shizuokensis]
MATLIKRTADQILQDALTYIPANTPITNLTPGAIARALVEAMKDEYPRLYDYAETILNMGFLSTAEGQYLDLIGGLFSYPRRTTTVIDQTTGEMNDVLIDDDTYRYEISQRVLAAANANLTALRLAILPVPGVDDVVEKEYAQGTGSFSFYVITSNGFTPESVQSQVQAAVEDVKAFGVRDNILLPTEIPLDISLQLTLADSVSDQDAQLIQLNVKTAIYNYIGNLSMGQGLIYNELVKAIMDADSRIQEFTITQFYLNNEPALLTNQNVNDDERIVVSSVNVS